MLRIPATTYFVVLLFVLFSSASFMLAQDSLIFLGRLENTHLGGILHDYSGGEDWLYDLHFDDLQPTTDKFTPTAHRFQSMTDSVWHRLDTVNGSAHRVRFSWRVTHGDFNGDQKRDYVGDGYWIYLGTDSGYVGDSTGGQYIQAEFIADFDGDGYDDVGANDTRDGWIIWWGDSANPLESKSIVRAPYVDSTTFSKGGTREIRLMDRYSGSTVAGCFTIRNLDQPPGAKAWYYSALRVAEGELQAHLDTIQCDSIFLEISTSPNFGFGNIIRRIGDTTLIQDLGGRLFLHAGGVSIRHDFTDKTGPSIVAGFHQGWHQRFLPYDYLKMDTVITLLEFDTDSLKYRHTYEFLLNNVDSGDVMRYCSMFPDVNGDGYLELGITYRKSRDEYYTNVYDVWGGVPNTAVMNVDESIGWGEPTVRRGSLFWKASQDGPCVIEVCDLQGKVLHRAITTGESAREAGLRLLPDTVDVNLFLIRVAQFGKHQTFKTIGGGSAR